MNRFLLMLCSYALATFLHLYSTSASEEQTQMLVARITESIQNAEQGYSKLTPEILHLDGMSSNKVRHFLNNLCAMANTHYLEIGCWKGSTWVSALYGNTDSITNAVAIDNWSEFGGPEHEFLNNCSYFLKNINYKYYSADAFKIDVGSLAPDPINIYFYDGNHSKFSQEMALTYYDSVLANEFILIVDDWNWKEVKQGTYNAISKLKYQVITSFELGARFNGDRENWWNGLYVAVIRKPLNQYN